jgi:hypothetical protein
MEKKRSKESTKEHQQLEKIIGFAYITVLCEQINVCKYMVYVALILSSYVCLYTTFF